MVQIAATTTTLRITYEVNSKYPVEHIQNKYYHISYSQQICSIYTAGVNVIFFVVPCDHSVTQPARTATTALNDHPVVAANPPQPLIS